MAPTKVEASSSEAAWTEREMNTLPVTIRVVVRLAEMANKRET